jgi:hypothetical protein
MFSPPEMMRSFMRSTTYDQPSSSVRTTSPVRNQSPPAKLFRVSAGRSQ